MNVQDLNIHRFRHSERSVWKQADSQEASRECYRNTKTVLHQLTVNCAASLCSETKTPPWSMAKHHHFVSLPLASLLENIAVRVVQVFHFHFFWGEHPKLTRKRVRACVFTLRSTMLTSASASPIFWIMSFVFVISGEPVAAWTPKTKQFSNGLVEVGLQF